MNSHASPLSSMRGPCPDYGWKASLEEGSDSALTLDRTCRRTSRVKHTITRRSSSPSDTGYGSSGDDINAPTSLPSVLRHLSSYARRAREMPKPYQRSGPTTAERLANGGSFGCNSPKNSLDVQRTKDALELTLKNLSSEALAQAVVTQHAEVEWRRLCALTTAWRLEAIEQHSKFLHMILEGQAEVYANAASEPLDTSVKELASCTTKEELEDRKDCTIAVYHDDARSFAVAEAELDDMETIACAHFHLHANRVTAKGLPQAIHIDSDASATSSDEDHSFGSTRGTSRNSIESDG